MDKEIESKVLEWLEFLPTLSLEAKVGTCDELTFEIRTKEKGHHIPHVHVSTSVASLSIAIETGDILAQSGCIRLDQKTLKKAVNWIKNNRNFLKQKWNELADCPVKFAI